MTVNSSVNSVILIVFAFSDNISAENTNCLRSSVTGCMPRTQYTRFPGPNLTSRNWVFSELGCVHYVLGQVGSVLPDISSERRNLFLIPNLADISHHTDLAYNE